MYRRMLVPLDGSELAEGVFVYAKELAGRLGLDVILLHVCGMEERESLPMRRAYIERAAELIERQSVEIQQKFGISAAGKEVKAQGELTVGDPAEEILRYVDANEVDLILMATHGRSGIKRWALGSVADKVLHAAEVPVWLVRAGIPQEVAYDKWPAQAILVPLDGSELAEAALPHVEALAKQAGTEQVNVTLLRVCELSDIMSPASYYLIPDKYPPTRPVKWEDYVEREMAKSKKVCGQYLAEVGKRLKGAGLRKVRSEVLVGKPADEIVDYANKNPFNLIVMSTHGRSGLSRWAYGSVAEKVLLGAAKPMLLVRPR